MLYECRRRRGGRSSVLIELVSIAEIGESEISSDGIEDTRVVIRDEQKRLLDAINYVWRLKHKRRGRAWRRSAAHTG